MSKVIVVHPHQVEAARRLVEAMQGVPRIWEAGDAAAEASMAGAEFVAAMGGLRGPAFPMRPSGPALLAAYMVALLLVQPV